MLVAISDIHLDDGTRGKSLTTDAFQIFRERLRQLAYIASFRADGKYRPLESIDLLLLGDIFELHYSAQWLKNSGNDQSAVHPWSDPKAPELAEKIQEITQAILEHNAEPMSLLRQMASGEAISLPPPTARGDPDVDSREYGPVPVNMYYMVGNHDWFYHLPGAAFDNIRKLVVDAMGLKNPVTLFPYVAEEWDTLYQLFEKYRIYARHGDYYDRWCYNAAQGRDAASLGDVLSVEMINRFPDDVERTLGDDLPQNFYQGLNEIINVRPSAALLLWIGGQFRRYNVSPSLMKKIKQIWNARVDEFINLDFVRARANLWNPFKSLDELGWVLRISHWASFETFNKLLLIRKNSLFKEESSFARYAITEEAFKKRRVNYIVYGHTHRHELIPLDAYQRGKTEIYQYLANTGTWRSYYDLSFFHPEQEIFLPSQLMCYSAFFTGDERGGRRYESWLGNLV